MCTAGRAKTGDEHTADQASMGRSVEAGLMLIYEDVDASTKRPRHLAADLPATLVLTNCAIICVTKQPHDDIMSQGVRVRLIA